MSRPTVLFILVGLMTMLVPCFILYDLVVSKEYVVRSASQTSKMSMIVSQNKNSSSGSSESRRLFYYHDSGRFVKDLTECIFDQENCHLLYWHVQKTGGSYIASKLYPIFNHETYVSREWCCNKKFMEEKFLLNASRYCSKHLGVYEVRPDQYKQVIRTCGEEAEKNAIIDPSARKVRYMGLLSIREPLQRSLSAIHQRCNVHSSQLDERTHSICERCTYSGQDRDFYEKIVNDTNYVYTSMADDILMDVTIKIPLYIVDNDQIDDLFHRTEAYIDLRLKRAGILSTNESFRFVQGKSNAEGSKKLCDFDMPSSLMKYHRPAFQAYHKIWSAEVNRG